MKYLITFLLLSWFMIAASTVNAQVVQGVVFQGNGEAKPMSLPGANVIVLGKSEAVQTDLKGRFSIAASMNDSLVVQFVGFKTDTIPVDQRSFIEITLVPNANLNEVEIEGNEVGTYISRLDPIKTEVLTTAELCKAACCNLSESFETNNSVDVVTTDAVTGTRQIQLLGLSGIYTQVIRENLPQMRGLISNAGFGQVPGTWIESIQISKGVGSVVNGFESIAGQINLELKKPFEKERMQVNGYVNQLGRNELNLIKSFAISPQWETMLLAHGDYMQRDWDRNGDGFMDNPDSKQWNVENRWMYRSLKNVSAQFGFHALQDEKVSGTTHAHADSVGEHAWVYQNNVTRYDAFAKFGYVFDDKPYKSVAVLGNAFYYKQYTSLDQRWLDGTQKSAYGSLIYQNRISGNEAHAFRTGTNVQFDRFEEYFTGTPYLRQETVAGVFFEYTLKQGRSTLVTGIRADHNNLFGDFITPRLHYKYMLTEKTAFRVSGGRGQRTANILEENIGYFASSRQLKINKSNNDPKTGFGLLPEIGWNGGGGLTHDYSLNGRPGSFSADAYYTWFQRQTVMDLDASTQEVNFYNLEGASFAFITQFDWSQELSNRFEIRLSYKYTDTQTRYLTGYLQKPFVAKHRALFNLAWHTRKNKWQGDLTANYVGSKRLPGTQSNPEVYRMLERSPDYVLVNAQLTRNLNRWAIYVGVENLLDVRQKIQIISPDNPHSTYFDASFIWGPTFGRVVYAGFRYILKEE